MVNPADPKLKQFAEDLQDLSRRQHKFQNPDIQDEMNEAVLAYMQKHEGVQYSEALRIVCAENPDLRERWFECFNEETRPANR
jgi:hypothetical protein